MLRQKEFRQIYTQHRGNERRVYPFSYTCRGYVYVLCIISFSISHAVCFSALSPGILHAMNIKRMRQRERKRKENGGRIAAPVNLIYLLSSPLGVYCLRAFVRSLKWYRAWECICVIVICACSKPTKWVTEYGRVGVCVCFEVVFLPPTDGCHSSHFANCDENAGMVMANRTWEKR